MAGAAYRDGYFLETFITSRCLCKIIGGNVTDSDRPAKIVILCQSNTFTPFGRVLGEIMVIINIVEGTSVSGRLIGFPAKYSRAVRVLIELLFDFLDHLQGKEVSGVPVEIKLIRTAQIAKKPNSGDEYYGDDNRTE